MRSRDTLLRLQRFRVEERRRQLADIEVMIAEFTRKETELTQQIEAEEARSGVRDPDHFNYPTAAKAAISRRTNLLKSVHELEGQMADARAGLETEEAELRKLELLVERDGTSAGKGQARGRVAARARAAQ